MKTLIAVILTILSLSTPAHAGGGGPGGGGATEMTQLMNNTELVTMVGHQADMAATQLQQYILQQVQTQIAQQHLIGLPFDKIRNALGPYGSRLVEPYLRQLDLTTQLRDAAKRASTVMSSEISAMTRLNMQPSQYIKTMVQYSKDQGGYYKQAVEQDMAALQDVQQRGQAWAEFQKNIPNINSEIGGMQTLATSNAHMVGEMQNMNATLIQMKAAQDVRGSDTAEEQQRAREALDQHMKDVKARYEADQEFWKKGGKK